MELVTSSRIAHDKSPSEVLWPTPHQDSLDQERHALAAGRDRNDGGPGRDCNCGGNGRDRRGGGGGSGHGGSSRRSCGGGSSGGGSSRDVASHRRTGGGGGGSGGGGHIRRGGTAGKGSRDKGGYSRSSSSGRGGHREHAHGGSYVVGSSSSSEDREKGPDVTIVSGKRQVVPCLVDLASSAEGLSCLTQADDRVKPVSSNVAHNRPSAIDAAATAAEAKHISSVKRLYVATPIKDIDRISTLPFSSSVNQSEAAQPLIHAIKSCLSGILMLCNERNS